MGRRVSPDQGRRINRFSAAGVWARTSSGAGSHAPCPHETRGEYQFVVNLKTAKALGLTIPPSVLARADEIIH
jgi:putative ABC transport system substrate-binding protein